MNDFERHVFGRLDNLEAELAELREATWPVCQGLVDNRAGVFANVKEKRSFFKFLHVDDVMRLLRRKAWFMGTDPGLVGEEFRRVRATAPRPADELV
jgi:hypothetical protein